MLVLNDQVLSSERYESKRSFQDRNVIMKIKAPAGTKMLYVPALQDPTGQFDFHNERELDELLKTIMLEKQKLNSNVPIAVKISPDVKDENIENIQGTQEVFNHRAKMNTLAAQGKWSKELEN